MLNMKKTNYYKSNDAYELKKFSKHLVDLIDYKITANRKIIILCIGTDRATGDSLGPIIGYKLKTHQYCNVVVLGTLKNPVHAKNLLETIELIKRDFIDPLIIAIDASLGKQSHIGMITLSEGSLHPGSGVKKDLPPVGDIYITGIVNFSGFMDMLILQNTRLNIVMELADFISSGIANALKMTDMNYYDTLNYAVTTTNQQLIQ